MSEQYLESESIQKFWRICKKCSWPLKKKKTKPKKKFSNQNQPTKQNPTLSQIKCRNPDECLWDLLKIYLIHLVLLSFVKGNALAPDSPWS